MADITINDLPPAVGLDGTERVAIAKNTGFGYQTVYTTTSEISDVQTQASYVLVSTNPLLPDARIIQGTTDQIQLTDGGAGGNLAIGLAETAVSPGSYGDSTHLVQITIDAFGRITGATAIDLNTSFQTYLQNLPTSLPAQPNVPWNNGGMISLS